MPATKRFEVIPHESISVLRLNDERLIDALVIRKLNDEMLTYLESRKPQMLLLDFSQVVRCGTETLTILLRARKSLSRRDGELRICGLSNELREVFKILCLDKLFRIFPTRGEAIEA